MARPLAIDVTWLERAHGSDAERAAFAEVTIRARGEVLTQVEDRVVDAVRSSARLCVLRLGQWLASNWWRLRWEPQKPGLPPEQALDWRMSHALPAAGGGFLWPAITIHSDGYHVGVVAGPDANGPRAPIRYVPPACTGDPTGTIWIPASDFEAEVDRLLEVLLDRLHTQRALDEPLRDLWRTVVRERADGEASRLRRAEALLGLDPDQVDAEDVRAAVASSAWLGDAAVDEVLAASRWDLVHPVLAELERLQEERRLPALDMSAFTSVPVAERAWRDEHREPWEVGRDVARSVRRRLGVDLGPLDLDQYLGIAVAEESPWEAALPFAVGFRSDVDGGRVRMVFRRPHPTGRRFEAARLVGDILIGGRDAGPVSVLTNRRTARQRAQRAFAQELLCPVEGLREHVALPEPTDEELEDAAAYYGVSEHVVRTALVNQGLVPRAYLPG